MFVAGADDAELTKTSRGGEVVVLRRGAVVGRAEVPADAENAGRISILSEGINILVWKREEAFHTSLGMGMLCSTSQMPNVSTSA